MTSTPRKLSLPMTVGDFLDWPGDGSGRTFQLVDGEPRAMSPGSATHGTIQWTVGYLIGQYLIEHGSPCRVVTEPAVAPRVRARFNLRVPDLGVTCTPDAPGQHVLPDPILLVEILSPGNASETWDNVWSYATIPTVQEILVVHSTRVMAELLRRQADTAWPEHPEDIGPEGLVRLDSVGLVCPLREFYVRTHLAPRA
jgi:Uma2 family endonuclease